MPDPVSWYNMSTQITDIGTAGAVRFVAKTAGYLRRIQVMLHGAITGSTENITVQIDNAAAVVVGSIPVSGSGEGVNMTPKDLFLFVKQGSNIEVINDGASTGVAAATIQVTLSP